MDYETYREKALAFIKLNGGPCSYCFLYTDVNNTDYLVLEADSVCFAGLKGKKGIKYFTLSFTEEQRSSYSTRVTRYLTDPELSPWKDILTEGFCEVHYDEKDIAIGITIKDTNKLSAFIINFLAAIRCFYEFRYWSTGWCKLVDLGLDPTYALIVAFHLKFNHITGGLIRYGMDNPNHSPFEVGYTDAKKIMSFKRVVERKPNLEPYINIFSKDASYNGRSYDPITYKNIGALHTDMWSEGKIGDYLPYPKGNITEFVPVFTKLISDAVNKEVQVNG